MQRRAPKKEQEQLFRDWVTKHQGILLHIARGFAAEPDQDDLVQDMLLALWHAVPKFRGESAESTFIYRVAQNVALTWKRGRSRQPVMDEFDEADHQQPPPSMKFERSAQLYAAIRKLPELDRSLLLMHLDEMPYRQIAETLGLSESNVGARLTRLRQRLARLIKE
ncbi:MAG: RNA polymerase sigma factor [Gammaproteobacteria bacterium]|nr:RNA polymerase sigma factor [Gammaproteobacteria bacterium]